MGAVILQIHWKIDNIGTLTLNSNQRSSAVPSIFPTLREISRPRVAPIVEYFELPEMFIQNEYPFSERVVVVGFLYLFSFGISF